MRFIIFFFGLFTALPAFTQSDTTTVHQEKWHRFYFYWGYNREWFSKSTIHFNGPNYDFTVYGLQAKDRPTKLGWVYFHPGFFSIPQYNYRVGFGITRHLYISAGLDHLKYVVTQGQKTTISGVVNSVASPEHAGTYLNTPVTLTPDILEFEHTNGFNVAELDLEWKQPIFEKRKHWRRGRAYWNFGSGGSVVVTKTDVKVLGDGLDNEFHISGLALAVKTGPRLEWGNRWFLSAEVKCGYANLPWVPIKNKAPENADHDLFFLENMIVGGVRF
jgi:hypothetical protein